MKENMDRAWLFELPVGAVASEPGDAPRGLRLGSTGNIAMADDGRAVRQSILLLLSTRPGERLMRPDYGCWLHRLVFAPNDAGTAGLAIHYVGQALRRWEPRVAILKLEAGANLHGKGDTSTLDIVLEYRVRRTLWEERLALGYDLHGARIIVPTTDHDFRQGDFRA
ncbi:phage baseplate outer wedge protein (acidic lysozyme), putative [Syntrophotalea carbinolica DSM 2380]|uniref:Phage baseplate outer wedge protein (Acidic lysozyme), putative n=1 Tax=Syntrophotalea carbinolica (strain DSM 2380 / NBRC 103641 / GraBd1) TaxID=338963 RepID=Q3A0I2_SYNC1|nr:GPW/gp25 family protein [Syntrophotalea carbinolica]ABA90125.1 phage baseplate outer wedge protein (acidic lysozyme), putative [Syntrophotalea carbinolica DSM 2380]